MIKIAKKIKNTRLERVLKNIRPKDRKIIREEIAKINKKNKPKKRTSKNPKRTTKKKTEYLVSLKREKELAEKGWKVARTKSYLEKPKKAVGKKGYPYAVLNKNNTYESFYTWKEKTSKKRGSD